MSEILPGKSKITNNINSFITLNYYIHPMVLTIVTAFLMNLTEDDD